METQLCVRTGRITSSRNAQLVGATGIVAATIGGTVTVATSSTARGSSLTPASIRGGHIGITRITTPTATVIRTSTATIPALTIRERITTRTVILISPSNPATRT